MKHLLLLFILACCFSGIISCQNKTNQQNEKMNAMNDSALYQNNARKLIIELRRKGISDERILNVIGKIPRHIFIDKHLADYAYDDNPLPIDKGQTISQPYTVAFQTLLLQLEPDEKVLEIGTGSGYQAAVLCELGAKVFSIERHKQLYLKAQEVLNQLNYYPTLSYGDGYEGLPEHAPFDKILITAATEKFPERLLQQLRIGGLMVAPIGDSTGQTMTVVERLSNHKYKETTYGSFAFVPMKKGIEE